MDNLTPSILPTLKDALYKYYNDDEDRNDAVHVSDLVYCQRKQLFRKFDEKRSVTEKEINFFSSGKGIHGALQALVEIYPDRFEVEREVRERNVVAHIDIWDKLLDLPIEIKTYRVLPGGLERHKPPQSQIQQLRYYMALTKKNYGILLGLYINNFEAFPFKEWTMYMNMDELYEERISLFTNSIRFQRAWDAKDPSLVPHIFFDNTKNWLCRDCPYQVPCQQMRVEELKKGALKPCEYCQGQFTHKDNCPTRSKKTLAQPV